MYIGLNHFVILSSILFCVGIYGVLAKRNAIVVLMSIEIMLNAVNILLVALSRFAPAGLLTGQIFALFVITVAAAEAAVALALIIAIYRHRVSIDVEQIDTMKG